jgi:hypothetical protein
LLGFPEARRTALAWRTPPRGSCTPTSNKIEFNRLNGNLMVPKIRPPTLTFNSNFHNGVKAETSFEFWVSMMGLMTT